MAAPMKLSAETPDTSTRLPGIAAMPPTRRGVSRSPSTCTPSSMPITLVTANGNTAAWLGGGELQGAEHQEAERHAGQRRHCKPDAPLIAQQAALAKRDWGQTRP